MNTTKLLRTDIIELLFEIDNEAILKSLYQQAKSAIKKPYFNKEREDDDIPAIAKEPIPDYIPFEQIVAEQGGFSMEKFGAALDELNRDLYKDETLEEMLNALT